MNRVVDIFAGIFAGLVIWFILTLFILLPVPILNLIIAFFIAPFVAGYVAGRIGGGVSAIALALIAPVSAAMLGGYIYSLIPAWAEIIKTLFGWAWGILVTFWAISNLIFVGAGGAWGSSARPRPQPTTTVVVQPQTPSQPPMQPYYPPPAPPRPVEAPVFAQITTPAVGSQCYICRLFLMESDPTLRCPSCNNVFHDGCLRAWIELNRVCPSCRRQLLVG